MSEKNWTPAACARDPKGAAEEIARLAAYQYKPRVIPKRKARPRIDQPSKSVVGILKVLRDHGVKIPGPDHFWRVTKAAFGPWNWTLSWHGPMARPFSCVVLSRHGALDCGVTGAVVAEDINNSLLIITPPEGLK